MTKKNSQKKCPSVSVIVPCYNVEKYIGECLDSLKKQTLGSIEFLLINDGSTDSTGEIIDQFAEKYSPKFKAFHKPNGGLSDARNYGIDRATGEYIGFVDSDDWVDETMFEEMYEKADSTNSEIVVCAVLKHKLVTDRKGNEIEKIVRVNLRGNLSNFGHNIEEKPYLLFASNSYAVNKIFSKSLFEGKKHRFPVGQWFEDSAVVYNLLADANKIECVPKRFYHYRFGREGAITSSISPKIFDIFKSCDSIMAYFGEKNFAQMNVRRILEKVVCSHLIARFDLLLYTSEKQIAWSYITRSHEYLDGYFPGWRLRYQPSKRLKRVPWSWKARKNKYIAGVILFSPYWLRKSVDKLILSKQRINKVIRERKVARNKVNLLQSHGYIVLEKLKLIFNDLDVEYFVDFGTLLGFVRDGGFMSHDLDLDIGVSTDQEGQYRVLAALQASGFKLWRQYQYEGKTLEESYHYRDVITGRRLKFDINYYEHTKKHSKTWLFFSTPQHQLRPRQRNIVEMKYSRIPSISSINIKGYDIPIPSNAQQLLAEKYGPNWETPDLGWIYWKSPAATQLKNTGEFTPYAKMNEEVLRQLQLVQLKVLDSFEDMCAQNGLRYYLAEGTLLGAVRHQGFIPWDNGIDISMPREDYDKLMKLQKNLWPEDLLLWNHISDPNYYVPFSKVITAENVPFRNTYPPSIPDKFASPGINVFPLDTVFYQASADQNSVAVLIKKLRSQMPKLNHPKSIKNLKEKISFFINPPKSMVELQSLWHNQATAYNKFIGNDFIVNWASSHNYKKQTVPTFVYGEPEMLEFEGKLRPCPSDYNYLLEQIYGEYLELPPLEKRTSASHFMIYDNR